MRFLARSLIGLALLSLTVGLLALAGLTVSAALKERMADDGPSRPSRERIYAVQVADVAPVTVAPEIEAFGEIRSRRVLELRAPVGGRLVWVSESLEDGAAVSGGDLIARIDARDAEGRRDSARADLAEAEAELKDAERTLALARDEAAAAADQAELRARALARQRNLVDRGVGTEAAVEEAELALSAARQAVLARRQSELQAQARIDRARSALDRLNIALSETERRLSDTRITAGFDGILADVEVTEGGLVGVNEVLGRLIDPDNLEVEFRLSAAQHARLLDADGRLTGADVRVSLDVAGLELVAEGMVSRESPSVAEGQTGRLLYARLGTAPGLRPGDFVTVRITEPPLDNVAVLPATAINANGTVLVVGAEDRLEERRATLLRRQRDAIIIAADGIAGARVVTLRTPFLGEGIKVRPLAPDAPGEDGDAGELVTLDAERRARLVAFVEGNDRMPADAKRRVLAQLRADRVPASMVARIEARMGG